jgi:hypothetical protein
MNIFGKLYYKLLIFESVLGVKCYRWIMLEEGESRLGDAAVSKGMVTSFNLFYFSKNKNEKIDKL